MQKQIPILFSTEMVLALLDGRKTMTRRTVKGSWLSGLNQGFVYDPDIASPYGKVGDVLYVRETFGRDPFDPDYKTYIYRADMPIEDPFKGLWRPSIHMPKEAARIWLEVVNVRVERVQDISEDDAKNEGIHREWDGKYYWYKNYLRDNVNDEGHMMKCLPIGSFKTLWQHINGAESWNANLWVWVVEFKVLSTTGKPEGI